MHRVIVKFTVSMSSAFLVRSRFRNTGERYFNRFFRWLLILQLAGKEWVQLRCLSWYHRCYLHLYSYIILGLLSSSSRFLMIVKVRVTLSQQTIIGHEQNNHAANRLYWAIRINTIIRFASTTLYVGYPRQRTSHIEHLQIIQ